MIFFKLQGKISYLNLMLIYLYSITKMENTIKVFK